MLLFALGGRVEVGRGALNGELAISQKHCI